MTGEEQSTADRAVTYVRDAIIEGRFPVESMLSEAELAAQLGVSRTPIRVAMARLQDEGWVRIYPKRGALVRGLSAEEIADLGDARVVLEGSGISLASSRTRRQLAEELAPMLERQRVALAAGDITEFIDLTVDFHGSFLHAGSNRYLIDLGERLADRQRWLLFTNRATLLDRSDHIIDEHQKLLDCLRVDDPVKFVEVLRAHVIDHTDRHLGTA